MSKFALAVLVALACPAAAAEHARGARGLLDFLLTVENRGTAPIACGATLAHWYSVKFGRADPRRQVTARLWFDPQTGTTFALNGQEDRMPVEQSWCGIEGRTWATRFVIALPRRAGAFPQSIMLRCEAADEALICQ